MSLFEPKATNWDKINGLRDLAGEKDTLQRYKTPWTVGGNIGNPSKVEPIIWTDLPPLEDAWSGKEETDFLLRNGTLKDSATDIHRITRLLTETTRGKLFSVKQNLLSRLGVATEASGILNEGVYLPTSTLAQVGVVGLGGHLNKNGVNPFRKTGPDDDNTILGFDVKNPLGLPAYAQVVRGDQETGENRLVGYFNNKINRTQKPSSGTTPSFTDKLKNRFIKLDGPNILDSYSGGPGSVVGVGYTTIRMSPEQRTGRNNVILDQSGFFTHTEDKDTPSDIASSVLSFTSNIFGFPTIPKATGEDFSIGSYTDYSVFKRPSSIAIKGAQIFNENASLSRRYEKLTKESTFLNRVTTTNEINSLQLFSNSVYKKDDEGNITLDTNQDIANPTKSLSSTLTQEQLREQPQSLGPIIRPDFRKSLTKQPNQTISNSLDYEKEGIITRVGAGDPGQRGNISNFEYGKINSSGVSEPVDKITAKTLYESASPKNDKGTNDLVKFRIAAVNSEAPSKSTYMHFRAFLGSFSDSYNSSWGSQKFMGRAESFHNYEGFDRSISMNWTVPAQSRNELMIMHQKLNYLASNLAPDYVGGKYMAGPLVKLTVGGYLYEQYGFIESLTLNIPETSPWEVAVSTSKDEVFGDNKQLSHDTSVKELPHVVEASLSFKPIHNFVVQKQNNTFKGGTLTEYGLQQYIALAASSGASGYNIEKTKPYKPKT